MLGHSVKETQRSSMHVVVSETPTTWVAAMFGAFAVLSLFLYGGVAGAILTLFFACWAAYAAVASEFVADRGRGELLVRRRIGPWSITRAYPVTDVAGVYVRQSGVRKGSGLAVRFKSGHTKGLTMSLDWEPDLHRAAASLNHYLHKSR
jgi:hypothetical protein